MNLKLTIRSSILVYVVGILVFYFLGKEDGLWFAVGGGLAMVNIFFAAVVLKLGFNSLKNKALFLGLLLIKSLSFVLVVALILIFLKPSLLPFTLGVTVVIFGAIGTALYETRHLRRQLNTNE